MNSVWRDAWWLSKFELFRITKLLKLVALAFGSFIFFIGFFHSSDSLGSDHLVINILLDFFFISALTTWPYWLRSKEERFMRISGNFHGSSYFNFLQEQQLPETTLIKSRLFSSSIQSLIVNTILISLLLVFPSILSVALLSPEESLAFLFFWLLIGIIASLTLAASDVGDLLSMTKIIIVNIIFYGSLLAIAGFYYFYTKRGVVEGSIFLLRNYPVVTLVSVTLLTIGSYLYCYRYAIKKMRTNDYL
ncbi:hypothetical protein CEW92_01525 [Bacillaceae bacterium SAS-127]|nr:hypothetical protein CEW92_01525 [Bacillaceae bacterium SAS-127]